ncbi:Alkylated DNA repair protein alkB homolog 8 [Seminavis robusta]|uniref:Alkylated DNA repair protein alkB homolog 8 n=1 Tax=Seminavis robusta TaxID=568900 RepID=A0A9N8H7I9_9STRA|nr:Alkylated DNA repair protein alkB homolog 8 [Seminavis robusta]|eukprot:Sro142_g066090.1 Alkylated DNA repair protein alkB homolog 8 (355) ;mRNA; r:19511-20575
MPRNGGTSGQQRDVRSFFGGNSSSQKKVAVVPSSNRKRKRPTTNASAFGSCPLCNLSFPHHALEKHASTCEGKPDPTRKSVIPSASVTKRADINHKSVATNNSKRDATANNHRIPPIIKKPPLVPARKPTSVPVPGLLLFEDFITEEEEAQILETLDNPQRHDFVPWKPSTFNGQHDGKRWGVHCDLKSRQVTASPKDHPLPWFMDDIIIPRLGTFANLTRRGWIPNEANAIDYRRAKGHYLRNHVDNRQLSKEPIANLSLAGDCYMTFINEKQRRKDKNATTTTSRVLLKRRCLQILTGEARYDYSHGIRHQDLLSDRRVSLTMRESPVTRKVDSQRPHNQATLHQVLLQKNK